MTLNIPDYGRRAQIYARWRAGFPNSFFERIRNQYGAGLPGQRLLDLGTGSGTLARGFAAGGCRVTASDVSEAMLRAARGLARDLDPPLEFLQVPAEETGLPGESFDVVTAGQCWHWFDRDRAALEANRLLKPGGRLVIAHFDYIRLPGNLPEASEQLLQAHNPAWSFPVTTGCYPEWLPGLPSAGFGKIETFSYDEEIRYSHEAWAWRMCTHGGMGGTLSNEQVEFFRQDLLNLLLDYFPADPQFVPHRVFAIVCEKIEEGRDVPAS